MLTTWNSNCGIAEYSAHIVKEFLTMKEKNNVLLLTNKPNSSLESHPRLGVVPVFGVHWWGEDPKFQFGKALSEMNDFEYKNGAIDVLFIQYQSSLYEAKGFNQFISGVKCPIILVQHDSTVNKEHDFSKIKRRIVHNEEISVDDYITFPTIERTASVFSFGMGRNDYDFIEKACTEIGVNFWSHDSRKAGWWPEEKLFEAMRFCDAVVLWYNDVPLKGQSAALRTAISSHRPVIVNNIGWFENAPNFVIKVSDKIGLQLALIQALHLGYIKTASFSKCAERYLEIANGCK